MEAGQSEFHFCDHSEICEKRSVSGFQYKPDTSNPEFMNNWFVTLDLVCENPANYNSLGSFYFFGYALGIVFFFLPDFLGRRKTMSIFYPLNLLSCFIAIYSQSLFQKKVGFFMIGLFHVKLSLS
jgi:MFS family permease